MPSHRAAAHSPFAAYSHPPRLVAGDRHPEDTDRLALVSGMDVVIVAVVFFLGALAGYAIGRLNLLLPLLQWIDGVGQ